MNEWEGTSKIPRMQRHRENEEKKTTINNDELNKRKYHGPFFKEKNWKKIVWYFSLPEQTMRWLAFEKVTSFLHTFDYWVWDWWKRAKGRKQMTMRANHGGEKNDIRENKKEIMFETKELKNNSGVQWFKLIWKQSVEHSQKSSDRITFRQKKNPDIQKQNSSHRGNCVEIWKICKPLNWYHIATCKRNDFWFAWNWNRPWANEGGF